MFVLWVSKNRSDSYLSLGFEKPLYRYLSLGYQKPLSSYLSLGFQKPHCSYLSLGFQTTALFSKKDDQGIRIDQ